MAVAEAAKPGSELRTRLGSALVMLGVAGGALGLGGGVWLAFVGAVAMGVVWEWWKLVSRFATPSGARGLWMLGGLGYIGSAAAMLGLLRLAPPTGWVMLLAVLLGVIGTDAGAFFTGRAFGGPRIAPAISPSKTWSGLAGGMIGAAGGIGLALWLGLSPAFNRLLADAGSRPFVAGPETPHTLGIVLCGALLATIAQTGDFFESWLKRRAGVKDSGGLIPGHGGLFDRTDGLLAVSFSLALIAGTSQVFQSI